MGFLKYLYKKYKDGLQATVAGFGGPLVMFITYLITDSIEWALITGLSVIVGVFATYCIILPLIDEYNNYKNLKE